MRLYWLKIIRQFGLCLIYILVLVISWTHFVECNTCDCDLGGSLSDVCDKVTGQCPCRPDVTGQRCNETTANRFVQHFDAAAYQVNGGSCKLTDELATSGNPFTGLQFASCMPGQDVEFEQFQEFKPTGLTPMQWTNTVAIRYNLNGTIAWNGAKLNHVYVSNSSSGSCPKIGTTEIRALSFPAGLGQSISTQVNIDTRCRTKVTLSLGAGYANAAEIIIDSLLLIPSLYGFKVYDSATASRKKEYDACVTKSSSLATRDEAIKNPTCRALTFSYFTQLYNGPMACACNSTGANTSEPCEPIGGQCSCKPGVFGRQCDMCKPRYFNFTSSGCTVCPNLKCPTPANINYAGYIALVVILALILIGLIVLMSLPERTQKKVFKHFTAEERRSTISYIDNTSQTQPKLKPTVERAISRANKLNKTRRASTNSDNWVLRTKLSPENARSSKQGGKVQKTMSFNMIDIRRIKDLPNNNRRTSFSNLDFNVKRDKPELHKILSQHLTKSELNVFKEFGPIDEVHGSLV